jgi:hypothetical protein
MRKMNIASTFAALLFASLLFLSCKKDEEASILGQWTIESRMEKSTDLTTGMVTYSDTTLFTNLTINFMNNGTAEQNDDGNITTLNYSLQGSTLTIFGEAYEVQTLTTSRAVLYQEQSNPTEKDEAWINLRR